MSMLRNQATDLLRYEHLTTTVPKAKELRPFVERLITIAKRGVAGGDAKSHTLNARRLVMRDVQDREVLTKLFDTLAPRFASRAGGYTRLLRVGFRRGDDRICCGWQSKTCKTEWYWRGRSLRRRNHTGQQQAEFVKVAPVERQAEHLPAVDDAAQSRGLRPHDGRRRGHRDFIGHSPGEKGNLEADFLVDLKRDSPDECPMKSR